MKMTTTTIDIYSYAVYHQGQIELDRICTVDSLSDVYRICNDRNMYYLFHNIIGPMKKMQVVAYKDTHLPSEFYKWLLKEIPGLFDYDTAPIIWKIKKN